MPKDSSGRYVPPDDARRCEGIRSGGGRCTAYKVTEHYCNFHDPEFDHHGTVVRGGQGTRKRLHVTNVAQLTKAILDGDMAKLAGERPGKDILPQELEMSWIEDIVLEKPEDVQNLLTTCMKKVAAGEMTFQQSQNIGYLASQWLSAYRTTRPGGDEARPMPEITEIERSSDPRAENGADHPGMEYVNIERTH